MARYSVNDKLQANGDHEVHRDGCSFMPSAANRTYLGEYPSCATAVVAAKRIRRQSNGSYYCSRECHTG